MPRLVTRFGVVARGRAVQNYKLKVLNLSVLYCLAYTDESMLSKRQVLRITAVICFSFS